MVEKEEVRAIAHCVSEENIGASQCWGLAKELT